MNARLGLVVYPKLISYAMPFTPSDARDFNTSSLKKVVSNKVAGLSFFIRELSRLDADGCIGPRASLLAQGAWIDADDRIDDLRMIVSSIINTTLVGKYSLWRKSPRHLARPGCLASRSRTLRASGTLGRYSLP